MKKLFFSLVAAMMAATATYAQSSLVATLSHDDSITMFYGVNAFQDAHNAAESGDIISISAGDFNDVTITKAITVRGTGWRLNSPCTSFRSMTVKIPDSDVCRFSVEGANIEYLSFSGSFAMPSVIKCHINGLSINENVKGAQVVDCIIGGTSCNNNTSANYTNSFLNDFRVDNSASAQLYNCVVRGYFSYINNTSLINSVLCNSWTSSYYLETHPYYLPVEFLAINSVIYSMRPDLALVNVKTAPIDCTVTSDLTTIFKTYNNINDGYNIGETFELTDEAKATYLGTDGKEVGLYGGQYPFTMTPNYPLINKLNVSKQATADGKLSVEIEVSTSE